MTRAEKRNMSIVTAREYYRVQNPIWCAIIGHKLGAVLDDHGRTDCVRCGGLWHWSRSGSPSLWEYLVLRPIGPFRRWLTNRRVARQMKQVFPGTGLYD